MKLPLHNEIEDGGGNLKGHFKEWIYIPLKYGDE